MYWSVWGVNFRFFRSLSNGSCWFIEKINSHQSHYQIYEENQLKTVLAFTWQVPKCWLFTLLHPTAIELVTLVPFSPIFLPYLRHHYFLKNYETFHTYKRENSIFVRYTLSRKIQLPISSEGSHWCRMAQIITVPTGNRSPQTSVVHSCQGGLNTQGAS